MVMGDALAVALMELKGFNTADFARYHPGGNLGKRLYLRVEDLFDRTTAPKVNVNASLKEVIVEMTSKRLGATAVVDENNVGIIRVFIGEIDEASTPNNNLPLCYPLMSRIVHVMPKVGEAVLVLMGSTLEDKKSQLTKNRF
jgi:hypothetical protein